MDNTNVLKIATHNSATGEKPANLLSWLVIPFSRTQNKTIQEQLESGVRMFDIRIKQYNNEYHVGHGLFTTKRTVEDILQQINDNGSKDPIYVLLTYEGKLCTDEEINNFKSYVNSLKKKYNNISFGDIAVKYTDDDLIVDWKVVDYANCDWPVNTKSEYMKLNGKNWQTYIPIPWLWKKIYYNKPIFSSTYFTWVDFL
jgi:hypothetical protein